MKITVGDWSTEIEGGLEGLFGKTTNVEAMAMEKATGETFERLTRLFQMGSRTAVTAFVWTRKKREYPTLTFEGMTFVEDALQIDLTDEETARYEALAREAAEEAANPPDADEAPKTLEPTVSDSDTNTSPTSSTSSTSESTGSTD